MNDEKKVNQAERTLYFHLYSRKKKGKKKGMWCDHLECNGYMKKEKQILLICDVACFDSMGEE
jgi:hypothetical protein